jgi:hypothetical protein
MSLEEDYDNYSDIEEHYDDETEEHFDTNYQYNNETVNLIKKYCQTHLIPICQKLDLEKFNSFLYDDNY